MRMMTTLAALFCGGAALAAEPAFPIPLDAPISKGTIRIELQSVAEGLNSALWAVGCGDGSGRLYVADQPGDLRVIENGKLKAEPVLSVKNRLVDLRPKFDERGLLGIAFHTDFTRKGEAGYRKLYTYTSEKMEAESDYKVPIIGQFDGKDVPLPPDHHSVVAEWQVKEDGAVDPASRRELLRFDEPQFNHNGGALTFDAKGLLYIAIADGGQGNDYGPGHTDVLGNAQDLTRVLGKILRIDPLGKAGKKSANGKYSIPDDNPLANGGGAAEIYAWGQRNPFRMSYDAPTGHLITGDIGQEHIEEINIIEKGGNYGWHIKEGSFFFDYKAEKAKNIFKTSDAVNLPKMIDPVAQYDHRDGISIIGGFVYRGKAIPALRGLYVFGEWQRQTPDKKKSTPDGRLFYCDLKTGKINEFILGRDDRNLNLFVTGFGQDDAGELYVLTNTHGGCIGDGAKVWKIMNP